MSKRSRERAPAPRIQAPVVDSHCHLDADEGENASTGQDLDLAWNAGLKAIVAIGSGYGLASAQGALALARTDPGRIIPTIGLHPHDARLAFDGDFEKVRQTLTSLVRDPLVRAVGEAGLDFHYDLSPRDMQREVFRMQIRIALDSKLPVVVHDRETLGESLKILKEEGAFSGSGVLFHCFSGDLREMESVLSEGGWISIPGVVTYSRSVEMQAVAREVPLDRLLVETDAPFLSPEPWRGHKNRPDRVLYTIHAIAVLRGTTPEDIASSTSRNAERLFGFRLQ